MRLLKLLECFMLYTVGGGLLLMLLLFGVGLRDHIAFLVAVPVSLVSSWWIVYHRGTRASGLLR